MSTHRQDSEQPSPGPEISVVIASYRAESTIRNCLTSLRRQSCSDKVELIVVDSSDDWTADIVRQEFPEVVLIQCRERKYPGAARNLGIARSRGSIIAFTDADCVVDPDWIAQVSECHQASAAAIGGAIINGYTGSPISWAAYFCQYSQWTPATPRARVREAPNACLSVKRWAFDRYGSFRESGYCSDTAFQWKLNAAGYPTLFVPSIKATHFYKPSFRAFLRKLEMHGRHFATVRVEEKHFGTARSLLYSLGSVLLPILLFARVFYRLAKTRVYFLRFLALSPVVLLGLVAWSTGEAKGYFRKGTPGLCNPEGAGQD